MSRASASMRAALASSGGSGSSAAAQPKFGEGKLLRTKHIDTLEVLETYSRDVDLLTRENQLLTEKLSKLSSLSGDPFAQLASLQTILQVERDSNQEMSSRIKIFGMEAERHRSELSNRDASLRDLSAQFSALRSELDALRSTHSLCISSRQALHESLDSLSRRNQELESHGNDVLTLRAQLDKQSARLQQLEIQAALGPPLPVASSSDDAVKLKVQLTKSKEKLSNAQAELSAAKAQLEQERARTEDQQAANKTLTESLRKLQAELATLSQQQQPAAQPAPASARHSKQLQQSKDELARREKEWSVERKDLLAQLEASKKAAASASAAAAAATATAAAAAAAAPARPSASERESRELILHLQSEVAALRTQLEHVHAQNTHLRAEHTKVSQALNKLLASGGGGGMGGLAVGGGKAQTASASITIASKQGGFAEVMSIKRENEALKAQMQEAQQIIAMLQHKIGAQQQQQQAAAATNAAPAASATASTTPARHGARASGSGQFSVSTSGGSKSLQLIAAHEAVHGPVSALQSNGSRQASPPASASTSSLGSVALRGSPARSSTTQAGMTVANQRR